MKSKIIANYHTHTYRCGHAVGNDREYVEEAIKAGIKVLGFADHSPMPYKNGLRSGMRMTLEQTEQYFRSVTDLAREYEKDIKIYAGVEAEYFPEYFDSLLEFLSQYPLDYMICGQHFIDREHDSYYMGSRFDKEWVLERYVENVSSAIKSGKFLYIAHPDLPQFTGNEEIYNKHMKNLCKVALEHDLPLEINVLGYTKNPTRPPYPTKRFFKIASEVGNRIVMGIDAHNPQAFHDVSSQEILFDFADSLNIRIDGLENAFENKT